MRSVRGLALVAVFAVAAGAWPLPAYAPQNKPPPPQEGKIDFAKASEAAKARPAEAEAVSTSNTLVKADLEQQAKHLQWQRDYERRGWEWHLLSTQLLFGVVILIVLFGLYITYVQFRRDYSEWEQQPAGGRPGTPPGPETEAPPAATAEGPPPPRALAGATTLKLTPAGLEVTSQIVGLIVLALSLAFFFLYVKEVYPIREVEVTKQANPPPREAAPADKAGK